MGGDLLDFIEARGAFDIRGEKEAMNSAGFNCCAGVFAIITVDYYKREAKFRFSRGCGGSNEFE